ncbi:conserved hypothetical protein [Agrobacterium tumefaciens str. CFBP 5621]|uniref:hypothetical protein n=1 Tax=Agrobacterium tumefaciens TaxID=358 RepID=UPI0009C5B894|nr:hypothetical protein [Agrobacterium tumefaciens]CUX53434.1 conserved hypothetical protein [Agrobacterium tumefaciens str. CFBP 5621]
MERIIVILDFIGKDCALDHQAIRNRNFAARIYPEFPSGEEIALVAARIGCDEIDFAAYEFGQPPRQFSPQPVGLVLDALFENSPYGLLIHFSGHDLWIWAPEDHEYLVVFGDTNLVRAIERSDIFSYSFAEYLGSGVMSQATVTHLRGVASSYTIG